MEEVVIITRDVNGERNGHYLRWDKVCDYINKDNSIREDEILLVLADGVCIYSGLQYDGELNWDDLVGFFA